MTTNTTGTDCIPCSSVGIIKPSRNDTEGTVCQIYIYNETYTAICGEEEE